MVDPYSAVSAAASALYGKSEIQKLKREKSPQNSNFVSFYLQGPLHGGANEAVLRMLESIATKENVSAFLADVKSRKKKLMGFGHRVYKNYDPRAKIIRKIAYEVFDILGREPLIDVAIELEKQALADEYFVKRKLMPNVDFFSGLICK